MFRVPLLALFVASILARAAELPLPQIEDLYLTDAATSPITLADGRTAIYCRLSVDEKTRAIRQSLWRVDDAGGARPLEAGAPDGFSPMLTPDGKSILFLSTRAFADGTPAVTPVPPYSDSAADLWLIPVEGGKATPLGGKNKPYGRVITDHFYGRVSFSPDGKRVAFVADDGRDPRTEAERQDNVIVVREDQGEGYEGYGATRVWVADLLTQPGETAASRIERVTPDDGFWYGDPQWAPDGSFLVVVANRTADQESVRYSINRNFDLWKIGLSDKQLVQLTHGAGPDFSPRISPDGKRLVCLSSPRKGPHIDIFNLLVVDLAGKGGEKPVLDFHGPTPPPEDVVSPNTPLPDVCWRDALHVAYSGNRGAEIVAAAVDVESGAVTADTPPPAPPRSPLLPHSNPKVGPRMSAKTEPMHWKSFDGLEIEGFLTVPPEQVATKPYKLVVMPHGGPHYRVGGAGFDAQIFATRGYAVFQPNIRGSTGRGLAFLDADRFDLGGADMRDLQLGIEQLIAQGIADRDRQFVCGVSYGGFMTAWLVGHTNQFRAAVAQNAVTDLDAMWGLSDLQSWTEYEMGGLPWEVPERMRAHSPFTYAADVRTPTLILHSQNDRRCPLPMGRMFYRALKKSGVETEMVIYPDEPHGMKQLPHRADALRRTLAWFEAHDRK